MSAASKAAGTPSSLVLGRACGGALIFALPILMTQEMWDLGADISRLQLALYWLIGLPILLGLSRYFGFEKTDGLLDDVIDAFVAVTLGTVVSAAALGILHVLDDAPRTAMNQIALQALPCAIGALLAQSQLRNDPGEPKDDGPPPGYPGAVFPMMVGALYLGLAIAPTEEIETIAGRMSLLELGGLLAASLAVTELFAAAVARKVPDDEPGASPVIGFLIFTVTGYAVAAVLAAYLLWISGRFDDASVRTAAGAIVVLAFPMSVGATAARVIL